MKIKTLIIPPYSAMTHLIEDCQKEEQELDIYIKVGNLHEAISIAKSAEAEGFDVIISRGGTAKLIERNVRIPVIDVHVSGYDMLRVLTLANDFPGKKAIVGFSNITLGAKAITDLLDIFIEVYTVERVEEVEPLIQRLKLEGFELIMGDVVTVDVASKNDLEGILIQSGREAIFESFQKAKTAYSLIQKKNKEIELLKSIIKVNIPDLIVCSGGGERIYEQWSLFSSQPVATEQLLHHFRSQKNQQSSMILDVDKGKVKVQATKVQIHEESYTLFTFSDLNSTTLELNNIKVDSVSQLPTIIHQSRTMMECLTYINSNLHNKRWILIGENGTGKKLLARYIHYQKFQGTALFGTATAIDLLKTKGNIDRDIKILYINKIEELNSHQFDQLNKQVEEWNASGLEIVFTITTESESNHSLLYDDNNVRVRVPSLRNRKEDIKALTTYFIASFHQKLGTSVIKIKDDAISILEQYHWPGNVAELKAILKDAVLAEKGYVLEKNQIERLLNETQAKNIMDEKFLNGTLMDIEKKIIQVVMEEENHNQTNVAKRLGINRSTLWRRLKE